MDLTRAQRFFADGWPLRLYLLLWVLFGAVALIAISEPLRSLGADARLTTDFAKLLALVAAMSFLSGLVTSVFVVWPFYEARIQSNGGPFSIGDTVRVLSRRHRGHEGRVYATWQGGALRVELGTMRGTEFDDIFSPVELMRVAALDVPAQRPTPTAR